MGELYGLELDLNTAVIKKQNKTVLPKPRERTRLSRADRLFGEMRGGNCVFIFCISGLWAQGWDAGWRSGCLAQSPQCFGGWGRFQGLAWLSADIGPAAHSPSRTSVAGCFSHIQNDTYI